MVRAMLTEYGESMDTTSISQERLVKNELILRDENEKALKKLHNILDSEDKILFVCECSRLACKDRIGLTNKQFYDMHRNRQHFIIMPSHETEAVERVVRKTEDFYIVEKYADTSE